MLDEEAKAIEEVARTTGKAIDVAKSTGSFLEQIFGETFRQIGGVASDWARYFRFKNFLLIADKTSCIIEGRQITSKIIPIQPQFALPLLETASLEVEGDIQELWAGLIANAVDPKIHLRIRKVFIEILRGLEPLDARILETLSDPAIEGTYSALTEVVLNADEIASRIQADPEEVKISLSTLGRYGCILDAWENTLESLDHGYAGFRVGNPKSNFRLSHLGRELIRATRAI